MSSFYETFRKENLKLTMALPTNAHWYWWNGVAIQLAIDSRSNDLICFAQHFVLTKLFLRDFEKDFNDCKVVTDQVRFYFFRGTLWFKKEPVRAMNWTWYMQWKKVVTQCYWYSQRGNIIIYINNMVQTCLMCIFQRQNGYLLCRKYIKQGTTPIMYVLIICICNAN